MRYEGEYATISKMKHPQLTVEQRTVLGKQVKKLRRAGIMPANIYGKNLSSLAIQVKTSDFQAVYKEVGETGLVDVIVNGETRPVLIKNLNMDFRTRSPLHADFYQVNLKEKVKTMVPLVIVGEAKAVTEKTGLLLQQLSEVEVEALPEALPEHIEVLVESLAAVDEQLTVADLKAPDGVTILTDEGQTVARIGELVVEEEEPEEVVATEAGAEGEEVAADEESKGESSEKSEDAKDEEKKEDAS